MVNARQCMIHDTNPICNDIRLEIDYSAPNKRLQNTAQAEILIIHAGCRHRHRQVNFGQVECVRMRQIRFEPCGHTTTHT